MGKQGSRAAMCENGGSASLAGAERVRCTSGDVGRAGDLRMWQMLDVDGPRL